MSRLVKFLPSLALLAGLATPALADTLTFIYDDPTYNHGAGWRVVGTLTGTLESNGNIFDPTGWVSLTWNGANIATDGSIGNIFGGPPVVTLDGSVENFSTNGGGTYISSIGVGGQYTGSSVYGAGISGPYVQADWAIATPEPASLTLLAAGAIGLAAIRRRRTRQG